MKKLNWVIFGPLFVIIGASLWGTETYFRVILNTRFDAEVLVFYEHLFCIFFSLPFAFNQKLQISGISKRAWVYLFLSGTLGSAVGTTFFTMSLNSLNSSVANVLLNFQPLVSTLFAALLLGERLTRRFFLWGVVALSAGLVLASNGFKFENLTASIGLLYIMTAAETGHLVFSTLHTNSASQTIDRIIDSFPPNQQGQVVSQLASTLVAIVSQRLIPRVGGGRVPATEIMLVNPAIKNLIRERKIYQIDLVIETSIQEGMVSLNRSLVNLVKRKDITVEQAEAYSLNPSELRILVNRG
jgi:twitching motility protein PilT